MITNTFCTIVRMNKGGGHDVVASYPCMWQEVDGFTAKRYGEDNADTADIYIPDINANVRKGDLIFRGEGPEASDTSAMLTIMTVARHDYGRDEMRHVRLCAR
ncbi:MAG: hypothetical protein J1F11_03395 [Oscillospiraceae bacterium]|nr:hypothetical protein [Oscillospiraceae bacterium]